MSRKMATLIEAVVEGINGLQPARQRGKTRADLMERLERRGAIDVPTPRGPLRFLASRGRHAIGMAERMLQDEPETIEWLETFVKPGEVLFDVGAAIGAYAMYAARGGAVVVAFEPKATSYGLLTEHLHLNDLGRKVSAFSLALSDRTGATRIDLFEIAPAGAMNALQGTETQFGERPAGFSQAIIACRLDDAIAQFGLPAPAHLKLDVDGAEGLILSGGPKALAALRSAIVEVEGRNAEEAAARIDAPLVAAGLVEDPTWRTRGSRRNRLFQRRS
jgi:FkbM family methyltransferase